MSYAPHIVYSLAITTFSIHLIAQRNGFREERSRVAAQLSILESIRDRLQSGERIPQDEMQSLRKLARPELAEDYQEEITWTEAFLGKKDIKTLAKGTGSS